MNVVSPILFLIFNRPSITAQSFARIRAAKPARLFVAADGPRAGRPDDASLCEETRQVVGQVDWPCEVHTLFRELNLGCRAAVSSAITWFFDNVEEGIILEDDCVPDPSFFPYCDELLERYESNSNIFAISGANHLPERPTVSASYYFSKYPHCWGWATWRRAWRFYDDMASWPAVRDSRRYRQWFYRGRERRYWTALFDLVYSKRLDSWAIAWVYSCWKSNALSVVSSVNLTENIGWGPHGTHTVKLSAPSWSRSARLIEFPLKHPINIRRSKRCDRIEDRTVFSGTGANLFVYLVAWRWRLGAVARRWLTSHLR